MKKFRYALIALAVSLALILPAIRLIYSAATKKPTFFNADGRAVLTAQKPATLTVWYYTESVVNGHYHKVEEVPDGVAIAATFNGRDLPLSLDRSTTVSMSDGEKKSLFSIPASQPGDYVVEIKNNPGGIKFAVSVGSGVWAFFKGFILCGFGGAFFVIALVFTALAATNTFPKPKAT